jgi:hypothetical protein
MLDSLLAPARLASRKGSQTVAVESLKDFFVIAVRCEDYLREKD